MKGFKVVQCIKIDSFYICFIYGCCLPERPEKLSLIMKKRVYDQVVLKLKHAQLHKKPTRILNSIQGICV